MFQLYVTWIVARTVNVILENVVAIQVGQERVVNNYHVILDAKNMGSVGMAPVFVRRVGMDVIARYVRL